MNRNLEYWKSRIQPLLKPGFRLYSFEISLYLWNEARYVTRILQIHSSGLPTEVIFTGYTKNSEFVYLRSDEETEDFLYELLSRVNALSPLCVLSEHLNSGPGTK